MTIRLFSGAIMAALLATTPLAAQQGDSFQGTSLLGERMVTPANGNKNVADPALLDRAAADAKAAFEQNMTVDTATWYGRVLFYQGYARESAEVYRKALKRHPDSPKLLRHLAHRQFSLRQFDESIETGLRAAELYSNRRRPVLPLLSPGPSVFREARFRQCGQVVQQVLASRRFRL